MDGEERWWLCLRRRTVQPDAGCVGEDRLCWYPAEAVAAHAGEYPGPATAGP